MKINFFKTFNENIFQSEIDTTDSEYISHTDTHVNYKHVGEDWYGEPIEHEVSECRNFTDIKNDQIKLHKARIEELNQLINLLESSTSYEDYRDKRRSKKVD